MIRLSEVSYASHVGDSNISGMTEQDNSTPKSQISAARLKLLELTPVQNCFIVDKSTFVKQYRDTRKTEIIKSKKLSELMLTRAAATPVSGNDSIRDLSLANHGPFSTPNLFP